MSSERKSKTGTYSRGDGTKVTFNLVASWAEYVACLCDEPLPDGHPSPLQVAMGHYRKGGFTPDAFANVPARRAASDALTYAEDAIEDREVDARDGIFDREGNLVRRRNRKLEGILREKRETIREVRRRLEWELWP